MSGVSVPQTGKGPSYRALNYRNSKTSAITHPGLANKRPSLELPEPCGLLNSAALMAFASVHLPSNIFNLHKFLAALNTLLQELPLFKTILWKNTEFGGVGCLGFFSLSLRHSQWIIVPYSFYLFHSRFINLSHPLPRDDPSCPSMFLF